MLRDDQDAFGQVLLAHLEGERVCGIVERDDGYIEGDLNPAVYFGEYENWPDNDKTAMTFVRGRVLDVGSGAGRHALYLQGQGHEVVCIDESPLALEVCKRRGVKDARLCPVRRVGPKLGIFDTIIMMGNNFGLMESRTRAPQLLRRFARITSPAGRIIAQTNNVYATTNPAHLAYQERNRQKGRMSGQLRLRIRFRQYRSPWFDYLIVSLDEMQKLVARTPWRIAQTIGDPSKGLYFAVLEKRPGRRRRGLPSLLRVK